MFRAIQFAAIAMACLSALVLIAFASNPAAPETAAHMYGGFFPYVESYATTIGGLGSAIVRSTWGVPLAVATMTAIHAGIVSLGILSIVDIVRGLGGREAIAAASLNIIGPITRFATWLLQGIFLTVVGNYVWEYVRPH